MCSPLLMVFLASYVLFLLAAMFLVPAAVVVPFHQLLVGPMPWLIAIGPALFPILGFDPARTSLCRLFPASRGPGPTVTLTIPEACDPHVVPAGPRRSDIMTKWGWSIRSDSNLDRSEIHAHPDLGKRGRATERRKYCR